MKKRFIFLFMLIMLTSLFYHALAESIVTYNTGHFLFDAPLSWIKYKKDNNIYLYGGDYRRTDGGYLMVSETHLAINDDTQNIYDEIISGMTDGTGVELTSRETILINGQESVLFSFNYPEKSFLMYAILCQKSGYTLFIGFADTLIDDDAIKSKMLEFADTVTFATDTAYTDKERIAYASYLVFGDSFISSRAGKYPTIDIRVQSIDGSERTYIYKNTIRLLETIKSYRDSYGLDFEDFRINVYADVMDVYGNTKEKQVLGFNITAEVIDRINYEKIPYENIPKIAINWYDPNILKY